MILVGMVAPIYPVEMALKMHPDIPGSHLSVIPGAWHAAIMEKPDACDTAIMVWAAKVP